MVTVYAPEKLIAQARKLAADYRRAMGKPLPGVSNEIAEHDAIRLLKLEPRPATAEGGYQAVDPPLVAPDEYLSMYSPDKVPVLGNTPEDNGAETKAREFLAQYYGLVACVDNNLGRLLAHLDKKGLTDNTFIILVSDHGDMAGEHGRYVKKTFYRNSMQVPMIVRYPARFAGGRVIASLVDPSVDTMPTMLEMCGIAAPDAADAEAIVADCTLRAVGPVVVE